MSEHAKDNLLGLSLEKLRYLLDSLGVPINRAKVISQAVHQQGVTSINDINGLSLAHKKALSAAATISPISITTEQKSKDGTVKWLFGLSDGQSIETVFIPETNRNTLCLSSQVGCALRCDFCSTGKQGFTRNLDTSEIISQIWIASHRLKKRISNVVFMGMGEPLLNIDNLIEAISILLDDYAYGLAKQRVTVSTVGMIPGMLTLKDKTDVALAVSLHAPNDVLRNELVPINRKYPLSILMDVCKNYFSRTRKRKIMFEYVMLHGINDEDKHARELLQLLKDIPCKINLIPFNVFSGTDYVSSTVERINLFRHLLTIGGIPTTIRKNRGRDIIAACGQLTVERIVNE